MALKEEELKEQSRSPKRKWAKWKRRGIIGATAVTGGTLLAVTGALAAPAIAAGFGALAPPLGTLVPVMGASGFAAVASAAGSVAGSVAVAASFGAAGAGLTGTRMARRTGDVDEFEFKAIGENHNQGVIINSLLCCLELSCNSYLQLLVSVYSGWQLRFWSQDLFLRRQIL